MCESNFDPPQVLYYILLWSCVELSLPGLKLYDGSAVFYHVLYCEKGVRLQG